MGMKETFRQSRFPDFDIYTPRHPANTSAEFISIAKLQPYGRPLCRASPKYLKRR